MNDIVSIETISGNLERRPQAVIIEALSQRMDSESAVDLAGDVLMALRLNEMEITRGMPEWLERRRSRPPL